MPLLQGKESAAAAGIDLLNVDKPTSDRLKIKRISISSSVAGIDFASAYACLIHLADTSHKIPLGARVCQSPNRECLSWENIDLEWFDGWRVHIDYYAQNAGVWYWNIEYEVIREMEEPKKKWPGWP